MLERNCEIYLEVLKYCKFRDTFDYIHYVLSNVSGVYITEYVKKQIYIYSF